VDSQAVLVKLNTHKAELAKGQRMEQDLLNRLAGLRTMMFKLQGAIISLEELLSEAALVGSIPDDDHAILPFPTALEEPEVLA